MTRFQLETLRALRAGKEIRRPADLHDPKRLELEELQELGLIVPQLDSLLLKVDYILTQFGLEALEAAKLEGCL